MNSPSITQAPLDDERLRKSAPTLLTALCWLYGLEIADDATRRTADHKMQKTMALRACELAIADATGMQPERTATRTPTTTS